jgi:hypothetical protein
MAPEGWKATEIDGLAIFKSGGTPSKRNCAYWGGAYPRVSLADSHSDGEDVSSWLKYNQSVPSPSGRGDDPS